MYLSLLERDACGPPSDEKLQSLAEVLGEQHMETLFAKAGRVKPEVVKTILRHPKEWSELIVAAKNLDADHLAGIKAVIASEGSGKSHALAKAIAEKIFWDRARDRVRSAEAFLDKEIDDPGKRTMEEKGKTKGRKQADEAQTSGGTPPLQLARK